MAVAKMLWHLSPNLALAVNAKGMRPSDLIVDGDQAWKELQELWERQARESDNGGGEWKSA